MQTKAIQLVWIVVKDFKRAIKFYTDIAGLKVVDLNEEWGWAELEGHEGGMRLGIAQQNPQCQDPIQPGQNGVVTFTVENIHQARQNIASKGANLIGEIQEIPGHVKIQTVQDVDGNFFQLVEAITNETCETTDKRQNSCCSH